MTGWQFWADRGGTFTDIVARRPDGRPLTHRLLSDSPARYADAAVEGVRTLLVITRGFRDALRIARQNRPSIFARRIELPELPYPDPDALTGSLREAYDDGIRAVAVVCVTNSPLTDPEVLEWRLPVRLEEFAVLRGSDCAGVVPGDVLVIETPGGAGYGPPSSDPHQAGEEIDDLRAF